MTKREIIERDRIRNLLREQLTPGDTIYTVLRHVSRSGMSRSIDLYASTPDGPICISGLAAAAMGDKFDRKRGGIKVGGCGMDMGFALVYELGATLWPKGTPEPHGTRNGEPDSDGGYALRHRWL